MLVFHSCYNTLIHPHILYLHVSNYYHMHAIEHNRVEPDPEVQAEQV
jgi:hypothetical protein